MKKALEQAQAAYYKDEVPIGAVLIRDEKVLAKGYNRTRIHHNPTAHAEIVSIQKAIKKIKNERFLKTTLYVTLEPCAMCAGAIIQARIPMVIFGAKDPKAGACGSVLKVIPNKKLNHRPKVLGGVMAEESISILRRFFRRKR